MTDWQRGDLAMCTITKPLLVGGLSYTGKGLVQFQIYTVAHASNREHPRKLFLVGDDAGCGRLMRRFVKLTPIRPDAEDLEAIKAMAGVKR